MKKARPADVRIVSMADLKAMLRGGALPDGCVCVCVCVCRCVCGLSFMIPTSPRYSIVHPTRSSHHRASIHKTNLEWHLNDDEFTTALGMPRVRFDALPSWKQTQARQRAGLF